MAAPSPLTQTPFSSLVVSTSTADRVARYILLQHRRGRPLREILDDPYVIRRLSPGETRRLLDRPDLVHARGEDSLASPGDATEPTAA